MSSRKSNQRMADVTSKDWILIIVSGRKDSLSLWDILLNLGYKTIGLYVDFKIEGFSEKLKKKIEKFVKQRGVELIIVNLEKEVSLFLK